MKRIVDDERLMLTVCEMYYNQNLGQKEIAAQLDISRPTISRLLTNARQKGLVRIVFADISGRNHYDLEKKLVKKYRLKEGIVTDFFEERDRQKDELGKLTAQLLERILKDGDDVGVSMGTTLTHIAPHVTADFLRDLTFVPLVGGVGNAAIELHSNYLAEALAKAFGGEALAFHAPAMVLRIQAKNELLQEESISRVLKRAASLDVAVCGIGAAHEHSTIIKTGYFNSEMISDFHENNLCGDICMRFFDRHGNLSLYEHNNRVIGLNIESLRKVPWSIGVAGGVEKAQAIRGAIAGRYINALVVDEACARELLRDGD